MTSAVTCGAAAAAIAAAIAAESASLAWARANTGASAQQMMPPISAYRDIQFSLFRSNPLL